MSKLNLNRDKLGMADVRKVGNGMMAILSAVQTYPPEIQVAALAVISLLYERETALHLSDIRTFANNIMFDGMEVRPEFQAAKSYFKRHILKEQ